LIEIKARDEAGQATNPMRLGYSRGFLPHAEQVQWQA
jgi:hypothetical protein